MRKHVKTVLVVGGAVCMTFGSGMSSMAGTWRTGAKPNQDKWWYDYDNGAYAADGWQWIDGNNDGTAECYYFDQAGWMLANTKTPDGYSVNGDGAWLEDGVVQTRGEQKQPEENKTPENQAPAEQGAQSQAAHGSYFAGTFDAAGNWAEDRDMMSADFWQDYFTMLISQDADSISALSTAQRFDLWAQKSARGAYWKSAMNTYGIPYESIFSQIENQAGSGGSISFTTTADISQDALRDVETVTKMLIDIKTDGMGQATFTTSQASDGGKATVTFTYKMMG